jgi:hypothetical protein
LPPTYLFERLDNWFLPGKNLANTSDVGSFLALVRDYIDPAQPIISVGVSVPTLSAGLYGFTPASSGKINADFPTVAADGAVRCYDSFISGKTKGGHNVDWSGGVLLISMPDPDSLLIEKVAGTSCASVMPATLSPSATLFVR